MKIRKSFSVFIGRHRAGCILCAVFLFFALYYLFLDVWDGFERLAADIISPFFRNLLYTVSAPLPFSLFEAVIFAGVAYLVFLLIYSVSLIFAKKRRKKLTRRLLFAVPVVLITVFSLFCLTFAPCYRDVPVADKMGLDTETNAEELFAAAKLLAEKINESVSLLEISDGGRVVCPYTFEETNEKVAAAANAFAEDHPFYRGGIDRVKRFLCSPVMTYTHISGIYGFFTGEANVNVNYPEFILPVTMAHELSHARGIAPENECNFAAFVITGFYSDDPYLNYCAISYVFDEILSALSKTDRALANEVYGMITPVMFTDWEYYNEYLSKYDSPAVSEAANIVNSAYLKSQGQKSGTLSYSETVELVVNFVLKQNSLK